MEEDLASATFCWRRIRWAGGDWRWESRTDPVRQPGIAELARLTREAGCPSARPPDPIVVGEPNLLLETRISSHFPFKPSWEVTQEFIFSGNMNFAAALGVGRRDSIGAADASGFATASTMACAFNSFSARIQWFRARPSGHPSARKY